MSMTMEDMELMAFDPPHLGMPGGPSHCGRAEDQGRFVEIFVSLAGSRISEVGFLTSMTGDGMVCASVCCQALLDKTLGEALSLDATSILGFFPAPVRGNIAVAEMTGLCLSAARIALNAAARIS